MELTSLDTLKIYAEGQLVELPPFAEDQPFVAKLKRPSLLALAKAGKIPNELLTSAGELFETNSGKSEESDAAEKVATLANMLDTICESSFVSPTYAEIKEIGIELTDDQKTFVFQYAQNGVKALSNFRKE